MEAGEFNSLERMAAAFPGTVARMITRDEIYHRLEWYFNSAHNPHGPHQIGPGIALEAFFANLDPLTGRKMLFVNINKTSQIFIAAWNSLLFHGVAIPWFSERGVVTGIHDAKTFGDLINCLAASYQHAGWNVA